MRHDYPLTEQSRTVITDNYKAIAEELAVTPRYVYGIAEGDNPDPYAYFRAHYAACVRADKVPYWIYDEDLAAIRRRYRKGKCGSDDPIVCLSKKIVSDAETTDHLVNALKDGKIDDKERVILRQLIEKERQTLDLIETVMDYSGPEPATNGNGKR